MNASGNFFIAYTDSESKKALVKVRGFDKTGNAILDDTTVSAKSEATADPVVCVADDNKAVLGWTATTSDSTDIKRRIVNNDLSLGGDATLVNKLTEGPQKSPALGCTAEGKQVFLFSDDVDKNGYTEIFGRGFNE